MARRRLFKILSDSSRIWKVIQHLFRETKDLQNYSSSKDQPARKFSIVQNGQYKYGRYLLY